MPKFYLVYEKRTPYQLPLGVFDTLAEAARFMGVSWRYARYIATGERTSTNFGIFIDEVAKSETI
jgi:hypothetical protein